MKRNNHEKSESRSYEAKEKRLKMEPEYKSKGNKPKRGGKRC